VTKDGYTADQLWAQKADYITNKLVPPEKPRGKARTKIKVLSRERVK
jgi:hypothetical protein